ncbi:hypothetical protein Bca101_057071 [Brassica carinata]
MTMNPAGGKYKTPHHQYKMSIAGETVVRGSDLTDNHVIGRVHDLDPVQTVKAQGEDRKRVEFRLIDSHYRLFSKTRPPSRLDAVRRLTAASAEMEGLSYARCFNSCADETSDEFSLDCIERGYKTGECDAPTGRVAGRDVILLGRTVGSQGRPLASSCLIFRRLQPNAVWSTWLVWRAEASRFSGLVDKWNPVPTISLALAQILLHLSLRQVMPPCDRKVTMPALETFEQARDLAAAVDEFQFDGVGGVSSPVSYGLWQLTCLILIRE